MRETVQSQDRKNYWVTYHTRGVENLNGEKLSVFCNTIGLRTYSPSTMSTMPVVICVGAIPSEVCNEGCTTLELRMGDGNTCVDDIHTGVGASRAVVGIRSAAASPV